ncbi:hypothetical protein ACFLUV_00160 [Elusimicrobiota bacterium]
MKKFLGIGFTLVFLLAALITPASATLTRIAGLGIDNWMVESDDSQFMENPSLIIDNSNKLWMEWPGIAVTGVGGNATVLNNAWGGISKKCDLTGITGGLFVGRAYAGIIAQAGNFDPAGDDTVAMPATNHTATSLAAIAPTGKFDVVLAYPLKIADVGLTVTSASDIREDDNAPLTLPAVGANIPAGTNVMDEAFNSSDMGIIAGARKKGLGPLKCVELAVALNMLNVDNYDDLNTYVASGGNTIEEDQTDSTFTLDNGMNLDISARIVKDHKDMTKILYVNYISQDVSNKMTFMNDANIDGDVTDAGDTDVTQNREQKNNSMTIGLAANKAINEKTLMICAISYNKVTNIVNIETTNNNNNAGGGPAGIYEGYNWERKTTMIPVNIAVERELSGVFTSRLGLAKNIINKRTTEIDDPDYIVNNAGNGWADLGSNTDTDTDDNVAAAAVTIGLCIKPLKDLVVDTLVRQQLLFTGGFLASGVPETLVAQITATLKY